MFSLEGKIVTQISIYLDQTSTNTPENVYAKQYDKNSRYIRARFMTTKGQYVTDKTCRLNAVKPNGECLYTIGEANNDGSVTFPITSNMLTHIGNVRCDITIGDIEDGEEGTITTQTFSISVDRAIYTGDAITGAEKVSLPQPASDLIIDKDNKTTLVFLIDEYGNRIGNGMELPFIEIED